MMADEPRSASRRWKRRHVLGAIGSVALSTAIPATRSDRVQAAAGPFADARIRRVAGVPNSSAAAFGGEAAPALLASLGTPRALAVTPAGDLALAEQVSGAKAQESAAVVRRIDGTTGVISALAGSGEAGYEFDRGRLRWVRTVPSPASSADGYLGEVTGTW